MPSLTTLRQTLEALRADLSRATDPAECQSLTRRIIEVQEEIDAAEDPPYPEEFPDGPHYEAHDDGPRTAAQILMGRVRRMD